MKSSLARESPCVPYRLQAQSVTRYQSCTVDPRPARVVHCPDLNACLVNEGRKEHIDCNAVHFGYAIPINVVPLPDDPSLAELVLDSGSDLTPETVSYLINHHPQLRKEEDGNTAPTEENTVMATTANHHNSKFSTTEPEEDIAAIAKQISDHAEAIYQTWKSRGLAPTEILNCHTNITAADKFGSALTPTQTSGGTSSSTSPVVDLLSSPTSLNTNNLEKFVNNFVVEDKARQQQKAKTLPSSIQFALEKFEKKSNPLRNGASTAPRTVTKHQLNEPVLKIYPKPTSNYSSKPEPQPQSPSVGLSKYIMMDTIETTFPEDYNPQQAKKTEEIKSRTSASAATTSTTTTTTTTTGGSGLTTWPLKNKNVSSGANEPIRKTVSNEPKTTSVDTSKYNTLPNKLSSNEYLDEVAKEEERLINALKTGIIIAEDPTSKRNDCKTSGLLQKKNLSMQKKLNEPQTSSVNLVSSPSPSTGSADVVDFKSRPNNNNNSSSSGSSTNVNSNVVEEKTDVSRVIKKLESSTKRTPTPIVSSSGSSSRNNMSSVPHPELTGAQRMHLRSSAANGLANHVNNPVRPFLTRGSVAERVLIFEKCPTELMMEKRMKSGAGSGTVGTPTWKSTGNDVHSKAQTYSRDSLSSQKSSGPPPHTTLQRHAKANRSVLIPRFYYPHGKPSNQTQLEVTLEAIRQVFQTFPNQQATREKFGAVTKACGCPLYWKAPVFIACGGEKLGYVELNTFLDYWRNLCTTCHDPASKFMRIVTRSSSRNYILPEDLMPLVQDVVDTHPGLTFLKEAAEFHSRYVHTVISRIYYCVNQSWSGQITLPELRKSDFLQVVQLLETEDDINQVTQYFSYEHFYVIYCKFWELDRDHDLFIDKNDLARHSDHALSTRLIDRIFSGTVTRGKTSSGQQSQLNGSPDAKMSYTEFVWFLLAEEDKQHPRAIEYWFRCMDLDGDGYLSMYELEYFYDEQLQRMSAIGIECLPFEDCLCQMLDMIRPIVPGKISLSDLKRCKMTPIFFDTFFNLEKYLDHEHRDPFASQRDHDTEMSDWDRYAAEEYELLVAEEGGNDNQEEILCDDRDDEEDVLSPNLDHILSTQFLSNSICGDDSDTKHHNGLSEGGVQDWSQPSLTVTYYDDDEDEENSPSSSSDSADYAADSDECSF